MNRDWSGWRLVVRCAVGLAATWLAVLVEPAAAVRVRTDVVAVSGGVSPDGNRRFSTFHHLPALNDAGQVAFYGNLTDTIMGSSDDKALFRGGAEGVVEIAREGDIVSGIGSLSGDSNINSIPLFGEIALNNNGQVSFIAYVDSFRNEGLGFFRGDGNQSPVLIARNGDPAPDGEGFIGNYHDIRTTINDAGQVAFFSRFIVHSTSILLGDGDSDLVQIVRHRQATPDGNGVFTRNSDPALNNAGQVAFQGDYVLLSGAAGRSGNGIFRGDGESSLVKITQKGDEVPGGTGVFARFTGPPAINDLGEVAFRAELTETVGGPLDTVGIFRGDGDIEPVQIVLQGDEVSDGNGTYDSFDLPTLNNTGHVAFRSEIAGSSSGSNSDVGIFLGDGTGIPTQVVRSGDLTPGGTQVITSPQLIGLNDAGQMAVVAGLADLEGNASGSFAIYLYDERMGLTEMVRRGGSLLGGAISDFRIARSFGDFGDERSSFNSSGQVAYQFTLADGRQGIAIATIIPEPSTLLLVLGVVSLAGVRRRG